MSSEPEPVVAVVMPAFEAARFVREAVDSVLAQTLAAWELVVVDDGSTDGTPDVVEAVADARVKVVRNQHSGLPAVGRNRGLAESTAPLVAFLDADDIWRPNKLDLQVRLLDERPDIGLVHAAAEVIGHAAARVPGAGRPAAGAALPALIARNTIYNSSVLVRRSLLELVGGLDEDSRLRGSEDYALWLQLACETRFAYLDEPLLRYRVHDGSVSGDRRAMTGSTLAALAAARSARPECFEPHEALYLRTVGGIHCFGASERSGLHELLGAISRRPLDATSWKWLALAVVGPERVARLLDRAPAARR